MAEIKMPLEFTFDIRTPLTIQPLVTLLMEGDAQANELRISLFDGKEAMDLSGLSVGGSFTRADGSEVPITGSVEGSVARAVLDEHCYDVAGPFGLYVQLIDALGNVKRTILLMAGHVQARGHGPIIDTGIELPSLDDILAQLETMRSVTNAANTATGNANSAAQSAQNAAASANAAATNASNAAGAANTAADRANSAAQNWEDGTAANAAQLGGKAPEYYLPAVNLLDNSDFAIAQAGYPVWDETNQVWTSGLHGTTVYAADRWGIGGQGSFTIANGVKTFSSLSGYAMLYQCLWKDGREKGKSYTLAIELADGSVVACSGVSPESDVESQTIVAAVSVGNNCSVIILKNTDGAFLVRVNALATGANISFKHLYMFEGIYTADTLPPYVPRPYAVELAECQRYLWGSLTGFNASGVATADGTQFDIMLTLPQPMLDNGKVISIVPDSSNPYATLRGASTYDKRLNISKATILKDHGNIIVIRAPLDDDDSATANPTGFVYCDAEFWLNKDL